MSAQVVKIQDLPALVGREVVLQGWAVRSRRKGKIAFLVVRDGTGTCQGVASIKDVDETVFNAIDLMDQEASIRVRGEVREDPRSPSGVELGIPQFGPCRMSVDEQAAQRRRQQRQQRPR